MKKRNCLFAMITAVFMLFALTGCGGSDGIKVSITNKADLTAAWTEGDADRTIELSLSEPYTLETVEVTVTSDNVDVVRAEGLKLIAVGGGQLPLPCLLWELRIV